MFEIGKKVICLNDNAGHLDGVKKLVKGEIYEILNISDKDLFVIPNDLGWDKSRFRLVDEQWTENVLSKLLEETKEESTQLS